jgi:uncharacterized protein YkwD
LLVLKACMRMTKIAAALTLCGLLSLGVVGASAQAAPSALEREVLERLNFANPALYAESLKDYADRFTGSVAHETPGDLGVGTNEGRRAPEEAAAFVSGLRPIAPVAFDVELARAAADHAEDQSRTGQIGHVGSDGSRLGERIWRHTRGRGLVAEIISYGEPTADRVVRQLVIDDGEADRAHRADVFDPALSRAGVACRSHPVYRYVCVIDLSGEPLRR